jgi:hypothetical protein
MARRYSKIWAPEGALLEIISAARTGLPEYKKILTGGAWEAAKRQLRGFA